MVSVCDADSVCTSMFNALVQILCCWPEANLRECPAGSVRHCSSTPLFEIPECTGILILGAIFACFPARARMCLL